jgi:glutamine---fructose-6-phosphate transaminase (isomerizing)
MPGNGYIERRSAEGKLVNLAAALERAPLAGTSSRASPSATASRSPTRQSRPPPDHAVTQIPA